MKIKYDRKEQQYAIVTIEDFSGKADCILWSKTYNTYGMYLAKDSVVMVLGKADYRGDRLNIIVEELYSIEKAAEIFGKGYNIWLDLEDTYMNQITELYKLCNSPDLKKSLCFHINDNKNFVKKYYVADDVNISLNANVVNSLIEIFGKDRIRILVN